MSKDYDYYLEPERLARHCAILQPLYLDLVLVIYAGEAMAPYRDTIKNMVRYLYGEILKNAWWQNPILRFRVRVIAYRDAVCDGENALQCTDFFSLPDDLDALIDYLDDLSFTGGETHGGNGMDALMWALESDWNSSVPNSQLRHNVMLITDSASVCMNDFQDRICSFYPQNLSADVERIGKLWLGQDPKLCRLANAPNKRMFLFAPYQSPWKELAEFFDPYGDSCVVYCPGGASPLAEKSTLDSIRSKMHIQF